MNLILAIHIAQYGDKWWGKVNPISVTQAQNGIVVVSKNNSVLGKKSIAKAREIFGDDVLIPSGKGKNYNNALYEATTASPKHAEPRGIQALLSNGIDPHYARQATTLMSCEDCLGLQKDYKMNNLTDKIHFGGK